MVPEFVIVTLQAPNGEFYGDYRLPTDVPVEKLIPLLQEALRLKLRAGARPMLYLQGYPVEATGTLADHGIWDGSILTVREAEK